LACYIDNSTGGPVLQSYPDSMYQLVRPHLKHAAPAWNPYLIRDINSLESVQRFASRSVWNSGIHRSFNCLFKLVGHRVECLCRSKEIAATSLLRRSAMDQWCM